MVRPILLNSTYIGTSTAIGGSMRIASRPKNRKFRPKNGNRANAYAAGTPTSNDRLTAPLDTSRLLMNACRKSARPNTAA